MSTPDHHPLFLQQCATRHEAQYRATGSYFCNPLCSLAIFPCRLRKCRREGLCCGPMVPSARLQGRIRMLRDVGLHSAAGTTVPLCMASADDSMFEALDDGRRRVIELLAENAYADMPWPSLASIVKRAVRHDRRHGAVSDTDDAANL